MKIAKELIWQAKKPRENAHQTGTGEKKKKKTYTRKQKYKGAELYE